jgi:hypothetical protein
MLGCNNPMWMEVAQGRVRVVSGLETCYCYVN